MRDEIHCIIVAFENPHEAAVNIPDLYDASRCIAEVSAPVLRYQPSAPAVFLLSRR